MISSILKTKFLITIADTLDSGDYDNLNRLHQAAWENETENRDDPKIDKEITELYNKYRYTECECKH